MQRADRGSPPEHPTLAQLEAAWRTLSPPPTDHGRVALLVRRLPGGARETPDHVQLTREGGLPGDRWAAAPKPSPEAQLTIMRRDVGELVARGKRLASFGDNLIVDLDLSDGNLPPGSRLRVGKALLEITPKPHTGCLKYKQRFGADALRFVSTPTALAANLRGIHARVVEDGQVRVGDTIVVEVRG